MHKYNKGEAGNSKNITLKSEVIFPPWIFIHNLKWWIIWRSNLFCHSHILFWSKYWIHLSHMVNHLSGNLFVPRVIVNFIYHSYIKLWDPVNSGKWLMQSLHLYHKLQSVIVVSNTGNVLHFNIITKWKKIFLLNKFCIKWVSSTKSCRVNS